MAAAHFDRSAAAQATAIALLGIGLMMGQRSRLPKQQSGQPALAHELRSDVAGLSSAIRFEFENASQTVANSFLPV